MLLKIVLLFVSIFLLDVKSDIADETEDRLLKFRDDVNQISVDFENFVYDIVKEILSSTDMHYLNPFSEARLKQNVLKAMKLPTKTVFGKKYFADITTPTMPLQLLQKMSTTTPKNVLENYWNDYLERSSNLFSKAGLKRIRRDTNDPKTVEGKMTEVNDCSTKTQQQQILERQHIQDLKEEVQKLRDLVVLLKSQQKLISVLDANNDTSPTEIDSKDLLDVLNDIDAKSDAGKPEEKDKDDHADSIKNQTEPRPTHDELERIKYDLRQTIAALNKTKDILTAEKDHEIKFENELNRQRKELNFLKFMVQQLYNKSYFTDNSSEIVGATIAHRPLELPVLKNRNITRESAMSSKRLNTHQTRANDLENLLKELDSSSDISRLQQEIDKKKREENIRKLLEKVMEQKESKALDQTDDTSSLLKKLQKSLHPPSRPQSKVDDVDVESELKRLENAINFMRPNNNLDLSDDPTRELEKLRELLDGIDRQGGGSLPIGGGPGSNKGLSPQQILALRRRLEMMSHGIAGNGFSSVNNDLTYGGQNIDANRRGFLPYQYPPYMDTYGNIAPTYPGYPTDPYRPGGFNNFYNPQSNGYPPHVPPNLYQNGNPAQFSGGFSTNLDNFDYRGKPFGGTAPYTETYSKPNDVNAPTYDFSKYYGGGSGASQSSYSKPSGDSQKPLPYSQALPGNPNNPGYASSDATNQFFPAPQPNNYDKSSGNGVYNAENADRGNPSQPGTYLPKNPFGGDYKSKNIEELKTQVNSLQNVINGLNYSGYAKKPEDQQTINNLEQQINELKGIINSLNQDAPTNQQTYNQAPPTYEQPSPIQQNYPPSNRRRRSVENHSVADLFEQITSKLKEYLFSTDGNEERTPYTNIQQRISNVKSQLERHLASQHNVYPTRARIFEPYPVTYHPSYPYQSSAQIRTFDLVNPKKQDLLNSIVAKIVDKILGTIPTILERLFGKGIYDLTNFGDQYYDENGYQVNNYQNPLKNLFKSLGVFGFGPLIFLKILDGFTSFVNILRKNRFFKNFLIPALVLVTVAGAVVFLIWWLFPSDQSYNAYHQITYDGRNPDVNNNNQYAYSSENYIGNNNLYGNYKNEFDHIPYISNNQYAYSNGNYLRKTSQYGNYNNIPSSDNNQYHSSDVYKNGFNHVPYIDSNHPYSYRNGNLKNKFDPESNYYKYDGHNFNPNYNYYKRYPYNHGEALRTYLDK